MSTPLVSLVMCVRNGMPHVREAVESVRAQTYEHYELVIQDGASTDGTREYLEGLSGFRSVTFVSEADTGQGQGFNRALQRCRGEIVGSIDADNRLRPGAVAAAVLAFAANPDAAVVYGACDMVNADGAFLHQFLPAEFDALGLLDGSIVSPFGSSYFSKAACGSALYFDEDFPVVPDFALWLRLAHLRIVRIFDVLMDVRASQQSSTYDAGLYEQYTHYKLLAARRYLSGDGRDAALERLAKRSDAGIYLWAVDSMQVIGGSREHLDAFFERACDGADLRSERFRRVVERAQPQLRTLTAGLESALLMCGRECLARGQFEAALVYFELLARSGSGLAELPGLMADARRLAKELHVTASMDVIDELEARLQREIAIRDEEAFQRAAEVGRRMQREIDRRDEDAAEKDAANRAEIARRERLFAEMHDHLQGEVNRRDEMLRRFHDLFEAPLMTRLKAAVTGRVDVKH